MNQTMEQFIKIVLNSAENSQIILEYINGNIIDECVFEKLQVKFNHTEGIISIHHDYEYPKFADFSISFEDLKEMILERMK